jgi:hypothetical protein
MENAPTKFKCVTPEISLKLFIMCNLQTQSLQLTGHPWVTPKQLDFKGIAYAVVVEIGITRLL